MSAVLLLTECYMGAVELVSSWLTKKPAAVLNWPENRIMKRVALIHNPASGLQSRRRSDRLLQAVETLRAVGIEAELQTATGPGNATVLAQQAIASGCDTLIACGGDGTVHELLQVVAGTQVKLAVIPFGTANALAADLGLIARPEIVARRLLDADAMRVPLGRIHYCGENKKPDARYFVVAAGVGADALLMSRLDARLKRKLGYVLYLIEALRIWIFHSFPYFTATITDSASGERRTMRLAQLLAVRVRSFGGALQQLMPGASVRSSSLNMLAFRTRSRWRMLRFLLAVVFRRHVYNGKIAALDATQADCELAAPDGSEVYVEADGEVLGTLPARLEIVPDALTLLVPRNANP